jgi:signal transduction histidine kinase
MTGGFLLFAGIISEAKNVLLSIKKDTETLYRQFYFKNDINITRNVIAFISLIIGFYTISDFLIFQVSWIFFGLVAIRISLISFSFLIIRYFSNLHDHKLYDKACIFWMTTISIGVLAINASRPENFLPQIVILDIGVLVAYLIIPTRFVYQVIPASIFSIGELILLVTVFGPGILAEIATTIFSILFSNIIGAVTSWQIHSYRWEIFQNNVKYKDSERLIAIGQTAGMVGHDIRNPLQAITGDLYLLNDDIQAIPEQEIRQSAIENIEAINENISYINKIISDLHDYSRTAKPIIEDVDLTILIKKIIEALNTPNNIEINSSLQPDIKLRTDSSYLKRIITNLGTNAIQAMPKGGTLSIVTECTDNRVRISVSDTGEGISGEAKDKIFTPLFTTKAKGQGLGLAVVKKLVEELHGSITFKSQQGQGTKFIINLPFIEG